EFSSFYLRLTSSVGICSYSILSAAAKLGVCWEKRSRRRGAGAALPGKVRKGILAGGYRLIHASSRTVTPGQGERVRAGSQIPEWVIFHCCQGDAGFAPSDGEDLRNVHTKEARAEKNPLTSHGSNQPRAGHKGHGMV
ncbi:hypothetical protein KIL84_018000, partial [Mauremys mutica]